MQIMADHPFLSVCQANFFKSVDAGMPIFLTDARASTPLDASPYYTTYEYFLETVSSWSTRQPLVDALNFTIEEIEDHDLSVVAILIGGSFTQMDVSDVNDIDCVIFYKWGKDTGDGQSRVLTALQKRAKIRKIDARLVPIDGNPIVLIKLISYFTIIYSKSKHSDEIVRPLLLLEMADKDSKS